MRILKVFIFLVAPFFLTSCVVYKAGGINYFNVNAKNELSKKYVKKYNIKFICPNTYELFWTDVYHGEGSCFYASDVYKNDGKVYYKRLNYKVQNQLKIEPKFSSWDKYGKFIVIPLAIFFIFVMIVMTFS